MQQLWDHIGVCEEAFTGFKGSTWEATNPEEMDEQTKKLEKTLK